LQAAQSRAEALAGGDPDRLRAFLHESLRWTAHTGEEFDLDSYVPSNTGGRTVWRRQRRVDPEVTVVADTAVLRCTVVDEVETADESEVFRMPMTQVWVRCAAQWQLLAGHAGPRLAA
jgi:hypothetical protein